MPPRVLRYVFWGLRVDSEIPLPELSRFERPAAAGEPDVSIRLSSPEGGGEAPETASIEPLEGGVRIAIPAVAWYRVTGGNRIEVLPANGAGEPELRLFLLGSAWGAVSYQRGILPVHAAVVRTGGGAVAFCGPSGAGKSRLAASLSLLGHGILGDDLCRAGVDEAGTPRVWPGMPRLKLWSEALGALGLLREGLERDHFRTEKFHVPIEGAAGDGAVPLRAIYLLGWGEERLRRLAGKEALSRFVAAATYRGELMTSREAVEAHWRRCLDLVRRVPVRLLERPRGFAAGERLARRLSESGEWVA